MRKLFLGLIALFSFLLTNVVAKGQNIANYSFTTDAASSLILDKNGNAIDMSTGTTELSLGGASLPNSVYHDDVATAVTSLPFNFLFMGVVYDRFSANSNGQFKLGNAANTTPISGANASGPAANTAYLAPLTGDNAIQTNGKVHYKVFGSAPNRVFVFEWVSLRVPFSSTLGTGSLMQLRLYEATLDVEYVYGVMYNNSTSSATRAVALSSSNTATTSTYVATITATPTNTNSNIWTTTSFALSSNMTNLHGDADGSRRMFRWTPTSPTPTAPTNLNFTQVSVSSMTLNWTDNSGDETGFLIFRSTDGVNYSFYANVAANTNTYPASALNPGTTYYWQVVAATEAALSTPVTGNQATNACSVSGTKTVGPTGDYLTLTAALNDLKTSGLASSVILELQDTYTSAGETFPLNIGMIACLGVTNTLTIRPQAGATALVISSNQNIATIVDSTGGSYVTIDGRPGGTGTAKELTIENTNTGGQAIKFINDASNSTVKYCTIRGVTTSTSQGVIWFSTSVGGTTGNSNITIDNCDIRDGASTPNNLIYSSGTSAAPNANNTISNSNIFNFFSAGSAANGISLSTASTGWTITGNHFYQTSSRTATTGSTHTAILISNSSGNNFTVSNNHIGGSAPSAGGTAWTMGGTVANRFRGISLTAGTTTPSNIQGNVIRNFIWSSSSAATTIGGPWCGIYTNGGSINIGTTAGNIIGSGTGTGSIQLTISTTGGISTGIFLDGGATMNILSNTIGSITTTGSSATVSHSFTGISVASGGASTLDISSNTIGSSVTANSINASNASTSSTAQVVTGIINASSASLSITNNTIANLNNAYAPASANSSTHIRGILTSSGICNISGNTIRNLSVASNGTGTTSSASVMGISNTTSTSGNNVIASNTIHSLANNHGSGTVLVTGIYFNGPTASGSVSNIVEKNQVYGLSAISPAATISGIHIGGSTARYINNIIRLGVDASGNDLTTACNINGIFQPLGTDSIYFNSVYIGGAGVATGAGNTYALNSQQITNTRDIRNNIFMNARSNATTGGKHYAVRVGGTGANPTGLTLNYNDYFANGTGGVFGFYNGADVADLSAWAAAVGQDANSINSNPAFADPAAGTPDLHLTAGSPAESAGTDIPSVTDDFEGDSRASLTPTDIGADAGDYALTGVDMGVTGLVAPATSGCYTASETVTVSIQNFSANQIDFATSNVTVTVTATGGYNSNVVLNSGTLAAGASMNVNMPATIDMSANGTYTFNANTNAAGDVNNANDAMSPVNRIALTLGGAYSVGTGGDFATLTAAVAAWNTASCFSGPVTFNLTDANYSSNETFPLSINVNVNAGGNSLTIKPGSGVNAVVSGTVAGGLIVLNGVDNVMIDGSNNGSSSRNLSFTNNSTSTSSAVIWNQSAGTNGATNNTIKNCIVSGNAANTTLVGIGSGSSTISSSSVGTGNNNFTVQNNDIRASQYGIFTQGASAGNKNTGNSITGNLINSLSPNNISKIGIYAGFEDGITISGNQISGMTVADCAGISLGSTSFTTTSPGGNEVINAVVRKNIIGSVATTTTSSAIGIYVAPATSGTTTIDNNSIYGVTAAATTPDIAAGIFITGGSGSTTRIYFNSVSMTGTRPGSPSFPSFALAVAGSNPVIDVKNNILFNTQTTAATGKSYAYGLAYTTYTNFVSTNNDLFVAGANGVLTKTGSLTNTSGTDYTTLATWNAQTGQDAPGVSLSVDPMYNSLTNLQLGLGSPVVGAGVDIPGFTTDILGNSRNNPPSMGAYENAVDGAGPIITYTALTNTLSTTNRVLASFATITDVSGVNTTAGTKPRLYYKELGHANTFVDNTSSTNGWKYVEATNASSPFDFTIDYSILFGGSVTGLDTIQYFVVAQDLAATPNVGINAGVFNATPADVSLAGAFPINGTINYYMIQPVFTGPINVGPGQTFPSLTANGGLFQAINAGSLSGNVIANITGDITIEDGTHALNQWTEQGAGNYTLTIQPSGGAARTVSGSHTTALIVLNGADRVTFDGLNTGGNSITYRNTSATTGAVFRYANDATFNTITRCTIEGGNTSTSSGLILLSTSTGTLGNSNNTFSDNNLRDRSDVAGVPANAFYSTGSTGVANAANTISNNNIFNFNSAGINLSSATGTGDAWQITANNIYNSQVTPSAAAQNGIIIQGGINHVVSGNFIGGNSAGATGTWTNTGNVTVQGISVTQGTASIQNNTIANITLTNTGTAARIRGIAVTSDSSTCVINQNTIHDLLTSGSGTGQAAGSTVAMGIYTFPTDYELIAITNNTIYNISIENTTALTTSNVAAGMVLTNISGQISGNKIYNIKNKTTGTTAGQPPIAAGLFARFLENGYVANNMISIGTGEGTNSAFTGIMVTGGFGGTHYYYHNSVHVGGTSGGTTGSFAFLRGDNTSTTVQHPVVLLNNILNMERSGGGSVNYAIGNQGTSPSTNWSSNFNDLNNTSAAEIGFWNATGYDFAGWKSNSAGDANSISIAPVFTSATDLHLVPGSNASLGDLGTAIALVPVDIDNDPRSASTPDMGADEFIGPACSGAVGGTATADTIFCGPGLPVIHASGYSTGTGSAYQWQSSSDLAFTTPVDITGQVSPGTLTLDTVTTTTYYRLKVTCPTGTATAYSNVITVTVKPKPTANAGVNNPVCAGQNINLTGTTDIGNSFNWTGPNGFASTSQNPTISNASAANAGTYTFTATLNGCSTSSNVIVEVKDSPAAPIVNGVTICEGSSATLTVTNPVNNPPVVGTKIGTGTTGTSIPGPYRRFYGGQRMQMLYTASELTASGISAGQISALAFIVTGTPQSSLNAVEIKLKNTSSTTLGTTFETGATSVYTAATYQPVAGTNTHTFNGSVFNWDGSSNLLVEFCFNNNDAGASSTSTEYTTVSGSGVYFNASSNPNVCTTTTGTTTTLRPNIILTQPGQVATYTWNPGSLNGVSVVVAPSSTTQYTVTGAFPSGCASSSNATVTVNPASTDLAGAPGGGVVSNTFAVGSGVTITEDATCKVIARVVPSGGSPVSGNVTGKVWIENSVPAHGNNPFVARHYEINAASNPSTSTGTVTLYFKQSEFDAFNADPGSTLDLPTGAGDAAGIANLRVTRYPGTSSDGSGHPASYSGTPILIDPADVNITWNAGASRWEVSFDVTGFSGFTVGTSATLNLCPSGGFAIPAGASGASYQWQVNTGSGFTNIADGPNYNGSGTATLIMTNLPTSFSGYQYQCLVDGSPATVYTVKFVLTWQGSADINWHNAANWGACAVIPDQYTDVVIPAGKAQYPTLSADGAARSVKTAAGTTVTVSSGVTLNITGQ